MKNIIVLGATGSIGDSVLSVIKQNKNKLNLLGIAFSSNIAKAEDIITVSYTHLTLPTILLV